MAKKRLWAIRPIHLGEILREDVQPAFGRPKTKIARPLVRCGRARARLRARPACRAAGAA